MYHSLARGYATQFLNQRRDHSDVDGWVGNMNSLLALRELEKCSISKKPGRVIKRIARYTAPTFERLRVAEWTKHSKTLIAKSFSSAQESAVFSLSDADHQLYTERAVFSSQLDLVADDTKLKAIVSTRGSVSHHALTRLFERDVATAQSIGSHMASIMTLNRFLSQCLEATDLHQSETYSFLIPYEDGALPIVTMDVIPNSSDLTSKTRVMAVRTFLDKAMLTDSHYERMEGFHDSVGPHVKGKVMCDPALRWIEFNARPFDLAAQSEREDRPTFGPRF